MSISLTDYQNLLVPRLRSQRLQVALLAVFLLGNIGLQLVAPQVLRTFIDAAQTGQSLNILAHLALIFLGVALIKYGLTLATTYFSQLISWTATNALRSDLVRHCLGLDMSFYHRHTPGNLIERIDGDVTALADFFSQMVIRTLGNVLLLIGVLVVLMLEDWRLGLAFICFTGLALTVLANLREIAAPHLKAERQTSAELFGFIEERLAGLEDIRANGGSEYTLWRLLEIMRRLWRHDLAAWLRVATLRTTMIVLFSLGSVLGLIFGAYLFWSEIITIGTVYLVFAYVGMLAQPVEKLGLEAQNLQRANASIQRVIQLLDQQPALREHSSTHLLDRSTPSVVFQNVWFGYRQSHEDEADAEPVLRDVSFTLEAGTILGLLGRTGSGKSTLARLLLRLYDPIEGTITLNGQDLRAISFADLREHIGVVTQDVQLFNATVRDNLTFFNPAISDDAILEVITDLKLTAWFNRLPNGLDTMLGTGGEGLSAGEAQLLAFTRVFLCNPSLIILDEASSRLDPATEQLVEAVTARLLHGRTAIVIAHRLATVQQADQIMVIDNGQVCEFGDYTALANNPDSRFYHLLQTGLEGELS